MKRGVLCHYVFTHLLSLQHQLVAYKKDKDPERIHWLRVEIKKIRAVYAFLQKMYHEKTGIKPFKQLFGQAANIRELQINIKLLSILPHPPKVLISKLKSQQKNEEICFIEKIQDHLKDIDNFKKNIFIPSKLPSRKKIIDHFRKEIGKARKMIVGNDRKNLHRFRMKIKKIMYVYNALPKKSKAAIGLQVEYIDKLQELAGDWHDTFSALAFLLKQDFSGKIPGLVSQLKKREEIQFVHLLRYCKGFKNNIRA